VDRGRLKTSRGVATYEATEAAASVEVGCTSVEIFKTFVHVKKFEMEFRLGINCVGLRLDKNW